MNSDNTTDEPGSGDGTGALPPIGSAVRLDMSERLTIPIAPFVAEAVERAAAPEPGPDHPALTEMDIDTIVGDILNLSEDMPVTRAGLNRLTGYIAYLERLRCASCSTSLGYHNYAGNTLCGPCANGEEPEPEEVSDRGLAYMPPVRGLDGSFLRVYDSSNAETDAVWLNLIGGQHSTTAAGDEDQATTEMDMREAIVLAYRIAVLARRRGYDIPALLGEAAALDTEPEPAEEDNQTAPAAAAPTIERAADCAPADAAYGADTVGALGEAAGWAARWSTAHRYAERLAAELVRIDALHVPYTAADGRTRCQGCIAGYDPATGQLVHCAYPCPTVRARRGELPL